MHALGVGRICVLGKLEFETVPRGLREGQALRPMSAVSMLRAAWAAGSLMLNWLPTSSRTELVHR